MPWPWPWLLAVPAAAASPYPLVVPDPSAWQAPAATAGFRLAAASACPGATVRAAGDQIVLEVCDESSTRHQITHAAPRSRAEQESMLALAANLIHPARLTAPPLPPSAPQPFEPVPAPTPAEPEPEPEPAPEAARMPLPPALPPEPVALAQYLSAPSLAVLPTQFTPPAVVAVPAPWASVRASSGASWQRDTGASAEFGLTIRTAEARWFGLAGRLGREHFSESEPFFGAFTELTLLPGLGVVLGERLPLEAGAWAGPTRRFTGVYCQDCAGATEGNPVLTEEAGWLLSARGELGLHIPVARGWELVPYLRVRWQLTPVASAVLEDNAVPDGTQLCAGVGVERVLQGLWR